MNDQDFTSSRRTVTYLPAYPRWNPRELPLDRPRDIPRYLP